MVFEFRMVVTLGGVGRGVLGCWSWSISQSPYWLPECVHFVKIHPADHLGSVYCPVC